MFTFTSFLAVTLLLPFVAALQLNTPTSVAAGGQVTVTWTTAAGDPPVFSLQLVAVQFNNAFAIANNVDTSSGTITINLPDVPPSGGYTLQAIDISNANSVFSTSGSFSIAGPSSANPSSTPAISGSVTTQGTPTTATTTTGTTIGTVTTTTGTGTGTASGGAAPSSTTGAAAPTFHSLLYLRSAPIGAIIVSVAGGAMALFF